MTRRTAGTLRACSLPKRSFRPVFVVNYERRNAFSGNDGGTVPITVVELLESACEVVEAERKNAALFEQNIDMKAKLVKISALRKMMREQLAGAERRVTALKTQSGKVRLAFEKLASESSMMEADLRASAVAAEEAFTAEKPRVKRSDLDVAALAEMRQQLLADCWKTSETASQQLAEDRESLQELQSIVATVTAELREWRKLTTETVEELKVGKANVIFQFGVREAAREEIEAQTVVIAELQKPLAPTSAKLLQLAAKHEELNNELRRVKS